MGAAGAGGGLAEPAAIADAAVPSVAALPALSDDTGIAPTETLRLEPACRAELVLDGRSVHGESAKPSAGGT
jgi:hypothetical protein